MLVKVGRVGSNREPRYDRPIDLPAPTIVASTARHGGWSRGGGFVDVLVEPWEDDVKVKAQAGGNLNRIDDVSDRPMSTMMAFQPTDVYLEDDDVAFRARAARDGKPPYRVPGMDDVRGARPNGRVAASTFAGAGGSSIGLRLAGFDVRCAVEVAAVPAESYRRNFPGTTVLEKDIRDVEAGEIMEACGVGPGELDLLDGSPPCTSFSTAGLRAKTWGKEREHAGRRQRVDDLFFDFARLVEAIQPRAFMAENVAGLARGAAIGYFKKILSVLRECGYLVRAQLLDADMLGVPQHRERIFFLGVRADVALELGLGKHDDLDALFPRPLPYHYTVRDALPWLDPQAETFNDTGGNPFGEPERVAAGTATPSDRVREADRENPTVTAEGRRMGVQVKRRTGGRNQAKEERDYIDEPSPTIVSGNNGSDAYHYTVEHDTGRPGREGRDVTDEPAPTIVNGTDDPAAGGGARSHWKVVETGEGGTVYRRKFTILEVKRLCSFPDDYELAGKFAEQWAQLGNSVPPLMAAAVAGGVWANAFSRLPATSTGATAKPPRRRRATRKGAAGRARGGSKK